MQIGDLIKHINDGELGLIIDYDAKISNCYKVTWPRWATTGWYTPDRIVPLKKNKLFS